MGGFVSSLSNNNEAVFARNADFSGSSDPSELNGLQTNGQIWIGTTAVNAGGTHVNVNTLTAGTGIGIVNGPGSITISATAGADLHTARFIVSAGGIADGANYTTIASAISAAQIIGGKQTVFIQPGTYTENLTMVANVDLAAYDADALTPNVTIVGKITASYSGAAAISGICLQTNSDNVLLFSSANATTLYITNCYLNLTNNTGFSLTNSNAASFLYVNYTMGNLATTGIGIFTSSMTGTFDFNWVKFTNTGNSTTASTSSAGNFFTRFSSYNNVFSFSSSGACEFLNSIVFTDGINTTCLTVTSSSGGGNNAYFTRFSSGSASAINYSNSGAQNTNLFNCVIFSNNTNAVTGSGFLMYGALSFTGTSKLINTTTQTGGAIQGISDGLAPSAGYIGEQISSAVTTVGLSTGVAKTITSINLTAGVWDISTNVSINVTAGTSTDFSVGISTTNNTITGNLGDTQVREAAPAFVVASLVVPVVRATLSAASTTYYTVATAAFTGTCNGQGRITATRVG